nr:PAS domain S-box protein [Lamprobacter modestohalophilus]
MIDLAGSAMVTTDMNGLVTQFNPAAERLLDFSAEEMIGQQTPLRFHLEHEIAARADELSAQLGEEIHPGFRSFSEPLLHDGEETREWTLQRADGEQIPVLLSTTLLRTSDGKPQGVLGNITDVSPLRQATEALRQERDRAQRYLDSASSIILSLDTQGRVTLANRYTCELLGRTEQDLLGQDWFDLCLAAEDRPKLRDVFAQLLEGSLRAEDYLENSLVSSDGSTHLIAWRSSLLHDAAGRVVGVLAAGNDITERHRMESARMQALVEAERLAALKNAFIANMSHEIRTPLNGILGLAQIGRRDYDTQETGQLFRHIQTAGQHLMILLNDILDFSKLGAGKLSIQAQPFCLADCLAELESLLRPQANAKGLRLSILPDADLPAWVLGDAMRLRQILLNLLGNAIKFTQTGEVRLRLLSAGEERQFQITDTGIGMNEEQIARIFQPFEQADVGTTRSYGGTGLGLSISLALAKMMGGSLSVDSEPNIGSCFELRLPLPAAEPSRSPRLDDSSRVDTQSLAGMHILAVDDVALNLMVLEDLLSHEGAQITTARDGQEALTRLEEIGADAVNLVLMDVQMPVMDGYEATRRIRAGWPDLPVIGLTAHAMAEERERCLNAGMVAHLTKPIDLEALLAAIDQRRDQLRQKRPFRSAPAGLSDADTDAEVKTEAEADESESIFTVSTKKTPDRTQGSFSTQALAPSPERATAAIAVGATSRVDAKLTQESPVDWDLLQQRFEQSPGFVQRLIETALSSQRDTPDRLRHFAAEGDLDECFRIAHMLKGFAAHLSAEPLRKQADRLCEQARAGDQTAFENAEELARSLEQLLQALAAQAQEDLEAADTESWHAG